MSNNAFLVRAIVAIVLTVLLIAQAQRASGPIRRRTFRLSAGAFALLALINVLALVGIANNTAIMIGTMVAAIAVLGSIVGLFLSYQRGEMNAQLEQAQDELRKRDKEPGRQEAGETRSQGDEERRD